MTYAPYKKLMLILTAFIMLAGQAWALDLPVKRIKGKQYYYHKVKKVTKVINQREGTDWQLNCHFADEPVQGNEGHCKSFSEPKETLPFTNHT